jgi:hypothetical protein
MMASILAALICAASQGFPTRLAEPDPTPDVFAVERPVIDVRPSDASLLRPMRKA